MGTLTASVAVQVEQVSFREKFAYGLGDLANNVVFTAVSTFMVFFYTDVAGITAGVVATIMLVSRLLDILTPAMGVVVDRTKTKYGKCRPWLLWMAVPFGIATVLLFTVPNVGPTGKIIYAFVTYNLAFTVIFTIINTPYGTLTALITQDQYQRSMLNLFRMILAVVGMLLINAITLPMVKAFGSGPRGWQKTFMCLGALATVLFFVTFAGTKERVQASGNHGKGEHVPLGVGLRALFGNKYWVMLALLSIVAFIHIPGLLGATIYYAQVSLGNAGLIGLLMGALMAPTLIGMFALPPLIKRFGKRNTAIIGTVVTIVGQLLMLVLPQNLGIVVASLVLKGLGGATLMGTFYAMVTDTIEYGEWKSGVRTEGLVYGAANFGTKLGTGLGAAIVGWVLGLGGYVGGAATQSPSAQYAIRSLFLYIPIGLLVLQLILLWAYKLDQEYPAIMAELQKRKA